jgi:hypothetical protein
MPRCPHLENVWQSRVSNTKCEYTPVSRNEASRMSDRPLVAQCRLKLGECETNPKNMYLWAIRTAISNAVNPSTSGHFQPALLGRGPQGVLPRSSRHPANGITRSEIRSWGSPCLSSRLTRCRSLHSGTKPFNFPKRANPSRHGTSHAWHRHAPGRSISDSRREHKLPAENHFQPLR